MAFVTIPLFSSRPTLARPTPISHSCDRLHVRIRPMRTPVSAKAREVTDAELEVALQANQRPLLVDCYADWCGPCRFLAPKLDEVAIQYAGKLDVLKLNTEKYPDLATALLIRGLPTLFFIRDGKLRYRMEGALDGPQLRQLIDYTLFDGPAPSSSSSSRDLEDADKS